ncbi:hypothetical protein A0H81_05266 [Grifola frondosa]|uniref:Uncharacterized protein n=1 Tax=Grifola frondosa TaxID=5627 RepID=A0A1C7MD65_GRIFR|nr:hypothetical protein A0H81_05266 [Grifola frondosa]
MALHAIVQTRRFDLAENLGCDASTYASVPAIILVWLPPLISCIATLIYACFILFTWFKRHSLFNNHAIDTSRLNIFTLLRPLLTSSLIASIVLASTIFSMYARITTSGGLLQWTSFYQVHARFSQVNVIPQSSRLYLAQLELTWWAIPACSLVLIAMSLPGLASREHGKAALDGYHTFSRWFCHTILRQSAVHPFKQSKEPQPSVALNAPASPVPIHLLKSGWDDTFRTGSSTKKLALTTPGGSPPATPPVSEDSFVQSTITYLESPTGREAHGLPPLLPVHQTPQTDPSLTLPAPIISRLSPTLHSLRPMAPPSSTIPSGSPQTSISICPPSPAPSHYAHSRPPSISSLTTSLASSTISTFAYAHEPGLLLHDAPSMPHEAPFQSAPAVNGARGPGLAVPRHLRRVKGRDALLPRSLSPRGRVNGREKADDEMGGAIYMTVVQETVYITPLCISLYPFAFVVTYVCIFSYRASDVAIALYHLPFRYHYYDGLYIYYHLPQDHSSASISRAVSLLIPTTILSIMEESSSSSSKPLGGGLNGFHSQELDESYTDFGSEQEDHDSSMEDDDQESDEDAGDVELHERSKGKGVATSRARPAFDPSTRTRAPVKTHSWADLDLSIVVALVSPIGNWLTGGDHIKNLFLIILLIFYLHQIIESGVDALSWFNTTLFVLATGIRPWSHLVTRLRTRAHNLHDAIHYPTADSAAHLHAETMHELKIVLQRVEALERELRDVRETAARGAALREVCDDLSEALGEIERGAKRGERKAETLRAAQSVRIAAVESGLLQVEERRRRDIEALGVGFRFPHKALSYGEAQTYLSRLLGRLLEVPHTLWALGSVDYQKLRGTPALLQTNGIANGNGITRIRSPDREKHFAQQPRLATIPEAEDSDSDGTYVSDKETHTLSPKGKTRHERSRSRSSSGGNAKPAKPVPYSERAFQYVQNLMLWPYRASVRILFAIAPPVRKVLFFA